MRILVTGLGIFMLLVGGYLGFYLLQHEEYTGKLIMSDSEYMSFKEALAKPSVVIAELKDLSSNSHFVQFRVRVPKEQGFDFGTKTINCDVYAGFGIFVAILGIGYILLARHNKP